MWVEEIRKQFRESLPADAPEELRNWTSENEVPVPAEIYERYITFVEYFDEVDAWRFLVERLAAQFIPVAWSKDVSWRSAMLRLHDLDTRFSRMQELAELLGVPEVVLRENNLLSHGDFIARVQELLCTHTAEELGGGVYVKPLSYNYLQATYKMPSMLETATAYTPELQAAIVKEANESDTLYFTIRGNLLSVNLQELWEEYIYVPEAEKFTPEAFARYIQLRVMLLDIPPTHTNTANVPDNVKAAWDNCPDAYSALTACMRAFLIKNSTRYLSIAAQHISEEVPWVLVGRTMSVNTIRELLESSNSCYDDLDALYKEKGIRVLIQEVLKTAYCMPSSAWYEDYVSSFEGTWVHIHKDTKGE